MRSVDEIVELTLKSDKALRIIRVFVTIFVLLYPLFFVARDTDFYLYGLFMGAFLVFYYKSSELKHLKNITMMIGMFVGSGMLGGLILAFLRLLQ